MLTRFSRARRGRPRPPLALVLVGGCTAAAALVPLLYVFVRAGERGVGRWLDTVVSPTSAGLLFSTLALTASTLALAAAIAVPMAWVVARTDLRGRRVWGVVGALPLVFPSYVAAFSLLAIGGPRGALVHTSLATGFSGATLALGLFTYPYLYLLLVAALRGLDPSLEENARVLGAGRWRTFRYVIWPQLRAPFAAGALLIGLYVVSDFGAVSLVRYNTLTLGVYNAYQSLFDRTIAASHATTLILLALLLITGQGLWSRRARSHRRGGQRAAQQVALGSWQPATQLALLAVASVTVLMPMGVIVFWGVRAVLVGNPLGQATQASLASLGVSVAAAGVTLLLALPLALWRTRYPSPLARLAERLSHAGYALPGLVVALSLVFLTARHLPWLYQTTALLVVAYAIRFLPTALAAVRSSLQSVGPRFEEAARVLGRRPWGAWREVTLPMIRRGLLAGVGLVFLTTMKELPATIVLRPTGFETLATRVWSAASEGIFSEAALPALLLVVVSVAPIYLLTIRPALAEREQQR